MPFTVAVFAMVVQMSSAAPQPFAACLPDGISLDEVASAPSTPQTAGTFPTIGATLKRIGARCRKKTMVDAKGREVRFHRLVGCWGNPPADYLEQQARQARQLAALKKKFTVVEIPCGLADPRKGDNAS